MVLIRVEQRVLAGRFLNVVVVLGSVCYFYSAFCMSHVRPLTIQKKSQILTFHCALLVMYTSCLLLFPVSAVHLVFTEVQH